MNLCVKFKKLKSDEMNLSRIKALIFLTLIFFAIGCGGGGIYFPGKAKNVERPKPTPSPAPKTKTPSKKPSKVSTATKNVFDAPFIDVWVAAIESVNWNKWKIAFLDERQGTIRIKEAYAYRKDGKLMRAYTWPSKESLQTSSINDYLQKIGRYTPRHSKTVFTQENMTINVIRVSDNVTRVDIDYTIRPYTFAGKIGYQIDSNGFIESLLLERIAENLDGSPVAKR